MCKYDILKMINLIFNKINIGYISDIYILGYLKIEVRRELFLLITI